MNGENVDAAGRGATVGLSSAVTLLKIAKTLLSSSLRRYVAGWRLSQGLARKLRCVGMWRMLGILLQECVHNGLHARRDRKENENTMLLR